MQWDWNEVDGVTTLSAPAGAIQGPLQAGLVFGVGRADETLLVSGFTHAVEHLAFQPLGHRPYWFNGNVTTVCTRFLVSGVPDDVVEFYGAITRNLADLPVDRLEQELQILRVEEQRSGTSQVGMDLSHRFGPRGVGLVGWPEHGLRNVRRDDLAEWARTWFTAGNAVLWTSAPLPGGLDLSALPQGDAPAHTPLPAPVPPPRAFAAEQINLVSVSAVTDGQIGIGSILHVAYRRAYDRLRRDHALSYGIAVECERLDANHALAYLGADGTEGKYAEVFDELIAVWDELAASGPTEDEWIDVHRGYRSHRDSPQARLNDLDSDAERQVLGLPFVPDEDAVREIEALSPDEVRDTVAAFAPTFFGVVPLEVEDGTGGFSVHEPWSRAAVDGYVFHPIGGREDGTLIIGDDGVSWTSDDDRVRTVRWDDAVCSFTWDDGRRSLQGPNGEWVFIVPWCWRGGHHLTERVDAAIGVERQIRLGEGETQYLQDPHDPESHVDVRWLASVIGARHRGAPVDLVIDTDGFFLLYSHQTRDSIQLRMRYLGKSDRLTLLSGDERNRWVPQHEIELVELTKSTLHRLRGAHAVLTIRLRDGSALDVQLRDAGDDEVAGNAFRQMLGPLFQATTTSRWD